MKISRAVAAATNGERAFLLQLLFELLCFLIRFHAARRPALLPAKGARMLSVHETVRSNLQGNIFNPQGQK